MSDWWTQSSTPARGGSAFTPARPGPAHAAQQHTPVQQLAHSQLGHSHSSPGLSSSSSRARFVNDDPDPSAADAPKFLPSFAASPAGKLALGSSPVSISSPPVVKRNSPNDRFSSSFEGSLSPRNSLRSRPTVPTSSAMDEDPIPTMSLHDDAPARPAPAPAPETTPAHPLPPALEPGVETATLHVFGPPAEHLASLRPYLEDIGPVVSYAPGPEGSNWWTVQYGTPVAASYALRRHGEIVSGRWMLAFKVAGPGSTQGVTVVNGATTVIPPTVGAGTPIPIKNTNIMRAKPAAPKAQEEYAWEQPEQQSGILGRAAEFIFGR